MYPVSREFQEKIIDPFNRRVYGKVQIDYTDPFLDQSINTEANENANVSLPNQIVDGVRNPSGKMASLDGSWQLDGTYQLFGEGDQIG